MITKKDTTQLLQAFTKVFATKQEAKKQHDEVVQKLGIVQSDIKSMKGDINTVQGDIKTMKSDINTVQGDIKTMKSDINSVKETLNNLTEMTGDILSWTDDIHKEIVMEKLPQRVHRIEKHLGFPVLAD